MGGQPGSPEDLAEPGGVLGRAAAPLASWRVERQRSLGGWTRAGFAPMGGAWDPGSREVEGSEDALGLRKGSQVSPGSSELRTLRGRLT